MKKRILVILICALIVCCLIALPSFADGGNQLMAFVGWSRDGIEVNPQPFPAFPTHEGMDYWFIIGPCGPATSGTFQLYFSNAPWVFHLTNADIRGNLTAPGGTQFSRYSLTCSRDSATGQCALASNWSYAGNQDFSSNATPVYYGFHYGTHYAYTFTYPSEYSMPDIYYFNHPIVTYGLDNNVTTEIEIGDAFSEHTSSQAEFTCFSGVQTGEGQYITTHNMSNVSFKLFTGDDNDHAYGLTVVEYDQETGLTPIGTVASWDIDQPPTFEANTTYNMLEHIFTRMSTKKGHKYRISVIDLTAQTALCTVGFTPDSTNYQFPWSGDLPDNYSIVPGNTVGNISDYNDNATGLIPDWDNWDEGTQDYNDYGGMPVSDPIAIFNMVKGSIGALPQFWEVFSFIFRRKLYICLRLV
jgi:hypothetical protein